MKSLLNTLLGAGQHTYDDMMIEIPKTKRLMTEDPYLTTAREHVIAKDAASGNPRLLINNPKRPVDLRGPTVLV